MSLTKEDLKAIENLMDNKLEPIKTDLGQINTRLGNVEDRIGSLEIRFDELAGNFSRFEVRLENLEDRVQSVKDSQTTVELVWFPRINAALEQGQNERDKNKEQDERITYLEKKADIHDTRLFGLENKINNA